MSDVVIFVGPPVIGRTKFYHQELCGNYHRVSATEVYAKDSSANLRIIIKTIVSELQRGHKIVIDDENVDRRTRLSYINGISKKIPGTTFDCYQFIPLHGTTQLHICKEWCLAHQSLAALQQSHGFPTCNIQYLKICNVSSKIDSHLTITKDLCLDVDCYRVSKEVTVPLVCQSSHKLTCPLLISHWEGMIESDHSLRKGVCDALCKWSAANRNGHIVVICESASNVEQFRSKLLLPVAQELSLEHPISYVLIGDSHYTARPPSTGLVVWLQYMFAATTHNKASLYIYHNKTQQNCAQGLSMRNISMSFHVSLCVVVFGLIIYLSCIQASKVFGHPRSVNSVHYSEREVHHILHDVVYVKESSSQVSEMRYLPLYHLAELLECSPENNTLNAHYSEAQSGYSVECTANPTLSGRHVCADVGAGRKLGMIYKDFECLERFQESWQRSLEPVVDTKVNYMYLSGSDIGNSMATFQDTTYQDFGSRKDDVVSSSQKGEETASQVSVVSATCNRTLPTWIQESSQCELELSMSAPKRAKYDSSSLNKPKPLSEAELLKTAEEVLSQHESTASFHQSGPMDTSTTCGSQYSPGSRKSPISTIATAVSSKTDIDANTSTDDYRPEIRGLRQSSAPGPSVTKVNEISTESILDALFT